MLALSLGATAHAEPSTSDIEKQIDAQWNQLEPVIEEHNKVQADLDANKAKVDALRKQIQPLEDQIDAARSKVAGLTVYEYKSGRTSALNALLAGGSSDAFGERLMRLESLARKQEAALAEVLALKKQYEQVKLPLDQLVAKLSAQEADLAKRKAGIDAEIKKLNDMRLAAFGSTGSKGPYKLAPCPATYPGGPASVAARTGCEQIGKPYVFGATGPNVFDCSGLTMYAWKAAGVNLRHYTVWQYQDTKRVSREDLRPGDLVFYYGDMHHMGMFVGNGWLLHAPTSGDFVRMKRMDDGPIAGYGRPG
jgi:cell wall-associated NlpC family hydrolase